MAAVRILAWSWKPAFTRERTGPEPASQMAGVARTGGVGAADGGVGYDWDGIEGVDVEVIAAQEIGLGPRQK